MTAKRMRKLLMAAGAPRNVANKAVKACDGRMPHEKLFFAMCFMPGLVKIFEDGVRYGADIGELRGRTGRCRVSVNKRVKSKIRREETSAGNYTIQLL